MLVGIFGEDFLAGAECELSIFDPDGLVGVADEIHLDAALV